MGGYPMRGEPSTLHGAKYFLRTVSKKCPGDNLAGVVSARR